MSARMTARSSSPNRTNTLTKGNIRTQVNLVYGNCNRMSLLAGNVIIFDSHFVQELTFEWVGAFKMKNEILLKTFC